MRCWMLAVAAVWSQSASACTYFSPPSFSVSRDAVPGERPAAPDVLSVTVGRGRGARPDGAIRGCDYLGWVSFRFSDAPPDGSIGYVFTVVSGDSPIQLRSAPVVTRDGHIALNWSDGGVDDQEPFSFVANVQTVSSTGARSFPIPVIISHPGTGSLALPEGATLPVAQTSYGECGIAGVSAERPLPTSVATCLERAFLSNDSVAVRSEVSLRLIASAAAMPDKREWERLVVRHLAEVDGNDISLTVDLAMHQASGRQEQAEEALRVADELLGKSMHWNREAYIRLGYALNEVRVVAASRLWELASADPATEASDASVQAAKERVRDCAIQWAQFARMSGQSVEAPLEICLATGASQQQCLGR